MKNNPLLRKVAPKRAQMHVDDVKCSCALRRFARSERCVKNPDGAFVAFSYTTKALNGKALRRCVKSPDWLV